MSEQEQRQLLASHRSQLAGLEDSIRRVEAEKAAGTLPAEVADPMITNWRWQVAAQRTFVDNCLRNLGELPGEPPVTVVALSATTEAEQPPADVQAEPEAETAVEQEPATDVPTPEQPTADTAPEATSDTPPEAGPSTEPTPKKKKGA